MTPPPDVAVGEYEAKLRPESSAFGKSLETEEQVLRIHVTPRSQNLGMIALLLLVLGLLGVVAFLGIRLSRT